MSWICKDYFFSLFFPLGREAHRSAKRGANSLKTSIFLTNLPLNERKIYETCITPTVENGVKSIAYQPRAACVFAKSQVNVKVCVLIRHPDALKEMRTVI